MTLVVLSIATSIDALAVGLSLSMLGISVWWPSLIIGIVALLFTIAGLQFGKTVAKAHSVGKYAELVGGTVLICIGLKILWDHGVISV